MHEYILNIYSLLCVCYKDCGNYLSNVRIPDNAMSRLAEMVVMTMPANSFSDLGTLSLLSKRLNNREKYFFFPPAKWWILIKK